MPAALHHALLFTFAFVLAVSLALATAYGVAVSMLADAYRYDALLERANERLRLVAVRGPGELRYGVRNLALATVVVRELGVVGPRGERYVLATDLRLGPGEAVLGSSSGPALRGVALYAATARGNVFAVPVLDLSGGRGALRAVLRDLVPGCLQLRSPVGYGMGHVYTAALCAHGYALGYLAVVDPHSDESARLVFWHSVAELFRERRLPLREERSAEAGPLSVRASFELSVEGPGRYRVALRLSARRADGRAGLALYGCVGVAWRTLTSTVLGLALGSEPSCACRQVPGWERVCECVGPLLAPSALDPEALATQMLRGGAPSVEAPSGSQTYIVLARCFSVETLLAEVESWGDPPRIELAGAELFTYLLLPGRVRTLSGPLEVGGASLELRIDARMLVEAALLGSA